MNNLVFIKMVLDAWHGRIKETDALLANLSDAQLMQETAPGRNRGVYLLGHLVAVHDGMLPLLGFGAKAYPQLGEPYVDQPDKAVPDAASVADLRAYWKITNATLAHHFAKMQPEEWFQRHNSVSAEDFAKEPHRNKLNIVINRTGHLAYHLGQMAYLKAK